MHLFNLPGSIDNMTLSPEENAQGAPQSGFKASLRSMYNIGSGESIINYLCVKERSCSVRN